MLTDTCVSSSTSATSGVYRDITATCAMQHLPTATLNHPLLTAPWQQQQRRYMSWPRHCNNNLFIYIHFGGGTSTVTATDQIIASNKNIGNKNVKKVKRYERVCVKRLLDNNKRSHRERTFVGHKRRGSMKLCRATSSTFSNNMMLDHESFNSHRLPFSVKLLHARHCHTPGGWAVTADYLNQKKKSKCGERNVIIKFQENECDLSLKSNPANLAHKTFTPKTTTTVAANPTASHPTSKTNRIPTSRKVHTITITTSSEQTESIVLMIREPSHHPQQTDLIELPTVQIDSPHNTTTSYSSSNVNPTKKNQVHLNQIPNPSLNLNTAPSQNRTTIVQIPKQSSRPRIFLLTRPAKTSLVRIAKPIAQHHPQKDLNSLLQNHPQTLKITATTNSLSQQAKPPVKTQKDLLQAPQEVSPYQGVYNQKITAQGAQSEQKLQDSLVIHQEIIQSPQKILSPSLQKVTTANKPTSELVQSLPNIVKKPIRILFDNTVQAQSNLAKSIEKRGPSQEKVPLTLASMAGIELTGADMTHTAADMSGAMPPTATVEEINVPVFIDEYLQQAAAISTTAASATPNVTATSNNISYNNNNNNNNNTINTYKLTNYPGRRQEGLDEAVAEVKSDDRNDNNNNNNNSSNNHYCLETFDNFEFDIDLLTENYNDRNDDQDNSLELQLLQCQQQQQQEHNIDISDKATSKQKELQLMLEEILFNSNSVSESSNINNNINNNNNIIDSNANNNSNTITTNNNMANGLSELYDGDIEDLFNVAPNSQVMDEILSPPLHDMDISNFSPTMENAVDFNQTDNDSLSLIGLEVDDDNRDSYFINSQTNAIMFPTGNHVPSVASSQNLVTYPSVAALSQEILVAEPHIAPEMIHYSQSSYATAEPTSSSYYNALIDDHEQFIDENAMDYNEAKLEKTTNNLKRHNSPAAYRHLQEKRVKLRLDIKPPKEVDNPSQELDTPAIINSILQNDEFHTCAMSPAENSTDIYNRLINSQHDCSVKSESDTHDYNIDISPPYTPYSVTSTSQQTNFTGIVNTAPSSPALSVATTNAASASTRRGRGRPAKVHSDMPDLSQVESEAERKKALERYKNNEASRKSRLKNKERDIATEAEERQLTLHNQELEMEFQFHKRVERKLRQALKRQHFSGFRS